MTAGRIILPGMMPAVDDAGDRVAGAKAYFYANGTATLQNVFTDNTLTVAHPNPVVADSLGVWPDMWADTATLYSVALADEDGAPLTSAAWDNLSAMVDAGTAEAALAAGYRDQAQDAAASALGAPGTRATSPTNINIATGLKVFVLNETGKLFSKGQRVVAASDADSSNQMSGRIADFVGQNLTVDVTKTGGAGAHSDWVISLTGDGAVGSVAGLEGDITSGALKTALSLDAVQNLAVAGRQSIWIPAAAMTSRSTNGAAAGLTESATNKVMRRTLDFDATTKEYAQFALRMPKQWNEGNITAVFEWSHAATATNFKVAWAIQAVAISDTEASDAAFGAAQQANDTGGTTDAMYASPETAAVTIAGAPAAEDLVIFQVYRVADDAVNDTLAIDARLHGVTLYLTTEAATDA